jgi:hypothetical protein
MVAWVFLTIQLLHLIAVLSGGVGSGLATYFQGLEQNENV